MKKVLTIFFVALGIIFFIIILIGVYLYVVDPLNIKPFIFNNEAAESSPRAGDSTTDTHSLLNESQANALETFGIDPSSIPSEITPEQEACFEERLGTARVAEIQAGDAPSAAEFLTARDCI